MNISLAMTINHKVPKSKFDFTLYADAFLYLVRNAQQTLPQMAAEWNKMFMDVLTSNARQLRDDSSFEKQRREEVKSEKETIRESSDRSAWRAWAEETFEKKKQEQETSMIDHLKGDTTVSTGRNLKWDWALVLDDPGLWGALMAWEFNWNEDVYENWKEDQIQKELRKEAEVTGGGFDQSRRGQAEERLGDRPGMSGRLERTGGGRKVASIGPIRATKWTLLDPLLHMGGELKMPAGKEGRFARVGKSGPGGTISGSFVMAFIRDRWWFHKVIRATQKDLNIKFPRRPPAFKRIPPWIAKKAQKKS